MTHSHGTKAFAIDKASIPSHTSAPVQVLVLGLSRTGTFSMTDALAKLGYRSYHMKEAFANFGRNHMEYWHEALASKYENQHRKYGKAELEKLLEGYTAVTDAPCVIFSDELLSAYPNAKVILTNRDPDKWLRSMDASYYTILSWRYWHILAAADRTMIGPYTQILTLILSFWTQGKPYNRTALREGFLEHYKHIRSIVPPSNLLEFHSEDGWGPLCKFLDKDVPEGPYPRSNEGSYTADRHWWAMPVRTVFVLGKALGFLVPVAVALAAIWWARSGR